MFVYSLLTPVDDPWPIWQQEFPVNFIPTFTRYLPTSIVRYMNYRITRQAYFYGVCMCIIDNDDALLISIILFLNFHKNLNFADSS